MNSLFLELYSAIIASIISTILAYYRNFQIWGRWKIFLSFNVNIVKLLSWVISK